MELKCNVFMKATLELLQVVIRFFHHADYEAIATVYESLLMEILTEVRKCFSHLHAVFFLFHGANCSMLGLQPIK